MKKTIAIASDHAGYELKEVLKQEIITLGFLPHDLGPAHGQAVDYPDYANALAEWLKTNKEEKGILVCGSGIGMSIAANRHRDVRAALCMNGLMAALARKHNDANVLCLGSRITGSDLAKDCLRHFLTTEFEGGRHANRVAKLSQKFKRKVTP